MSCKKWEEDIYLYDELSAAERKQVDDHCQHCADCNKQLLETQQWKQLIATSASEEVQLRNPDLLTRKIMAQIGEQRKESFITVLIHHVFTRYALTVCSLLLIIFFIAEQQKGERLPVSPPMIVKTTPAKVILNSNVFLSAIKADISNTGKNNTSSLYSCIQSNQCDYAIVKHYKQKHHENL